jgi:hypothetical protein
VTAKAESDQYAWQGFIFDKTRPLPSLNPKDFLAACTAPAAGVAPRAAAAGLKEVSWLAVTLL